MQAISLQGYMSPEELVKMCLVGLGYYCSAAK